MILVNEISCGGNDYMPFLKYIPEGALGWP
jgi:hypothetical protein